MWERDDNEQWRWKERGGRGHLRRNMCVGSLYSVEKTLEAKRAPRKGDWAIAAAGDRRHEMGDRQRARWGQFNGRCSDKQKLRTWAKLWRYGCVGDQRWVDYTKRRNVRGNERECRRRQQWTQKGKRGPDTHEA